MSVPAAGVQRLLDGLVCGLSLLRTHAAVMSEPDHRRPVRMVTTFLVPQLLSLRERQQEHLVEVLLELRMRVDLLPQMRIQRGERLSTYPTVQDVP